MSPRQTLDKAAKLAYSYLNSSYWSKDYLFGCIAIRKDGTEVRSVNQNVREPHAQAHAEARVLKKAGMGAVLYIARVTRDQKWRMAQPCPRCQMLIRNRKVKRVFYTIGPGEYGVWDPQENRETLEKQ